MKRNEARRYSKPETAKQMPSFFGKMGHDRDFTKDFAMLEIPLRECIRNRDEKTEKIEWNKTAEEVYALMRESLRQARGLILPSYKKESILTADASDCGIGEVLEQRTEKGDIPIAWKSRALKDAERRYGITEKELLAVVWGVEKFEYQLKGRQFHVVTDHKALEETRNKRLWTRKRKNAEMDGKTGRV
ncbi:hypothetical protein NEMIN01_2477 [Nematocida minor]|uniref:uncharacterized protein n=1 Tax=Nematocida minor TaxID=1912983 RepID=UPI00221EAC24|nr:uncharacterized protein NEMIN01_2477 [Nematocida minor]KAI5193321.1 hypothetical protein NEMIN01_2477 [Nematocida minor]